MSFVDRNYQVFSCSVTKLGKNVCGDNFVVHKLKKENLLLMAVADGISSLPCDFLASKTACETVVVAFSETPGTVPERLEIAASKANNAIRKIAGPCKGMMTSLSLAAWEIDANRIYFLNVGDSRIYIGMETMLRQVSIDDTAGILVKSNGKTMLDAGVPLFKQGVTRSLGQSDPLTFKVCSEPFLNNDLLILVTDGVFRNRTFISDIKTIFSGGNLSEQLVMLTKRSSETNDDDATLVVLWRTETNARLRLFYEECIKEKTDYRLKHLGGQLVIEFLKEDLIISIKQGANGQVWELFDYARTYNLKFSRNFISDFLSLVIKQGTDRRLVTHLRDLIRCSSTV